MDKIRVLFLCSGNSARSQMAEAWLRKFAGERFEVHSAGLDAKGIHPLTIQVMEEVGVDMSRHESKPLTRYLNTLHFGYLITVCDRAAEACPIFPGMGQRLHWPFEDPATFEGSTEEKLLKFRQVRDQIKEKILAWVAQTP
jgi:arsenate reductase (thioredoxin)